MMMKETNTCSLSPDAMTKRLEEIERLASKSLIGASRTPDGVRLRLENTPAAKAELERLIEAESKCCSFLRFELETGEELSLDVTGPADGQPLIDEMLTVPRR